MAECHPVGFQWVMEAKARGATIIHVDPRFTRTQRGGRCPRAAPRRQRHRVPRRHHQLRPRERAVVPRVRRRTTPTRRRSCRDDFRDTEDLDGLFSGFDAEQRHYDPESWQYEGIEVQSSAGHREAAAAKAGDSRDAARGGRTGGGGAHIGEGETERDETLQHPRCVFQVLKRHFSRYTPEMVEQICGVPPRLFLQVCETLADNSGRDRTTAFVLRGRLDPAHRRRAIHPRPPRSCNCCSATWAGRAAASSRCAATRASRARPTSRRCSTCCPATSRCRTRARTTASSEYLEEQGCAPRLLGRR